MGRCQLSPWCECHVAPLKQLQLPGLIPWLGATQGEWAAGVQAVSFWLLWAPLMPPLAQVLLEALYFSLVAKRLDPDEDDTLVESPAVTPVSERVPRVRPPHGFALFLAKEEARKVKRLHRMLRVSSGQHLPALSTSWPVQPLLRGPALLKDSCAPLPPTKGPPVGSLGLCSHGQFPSNTPTPAACSPCSVPSHAQHQGPRRNFLGLWWTVCLPPSWDTGRMSCCPLSVPGTLAMGSGCPEALPCYSSQAGIG